MVLLFDDTHDLDLDHDLDCDLWITIVGWVDVLYSDWGDFRSLRAVDISSSVLRCLYDFC